MWIVIVLLEFLYSYCVLVLMQGLKNSTYKSAKYLLSDSMAAFIIIIITGQAALPMRPGGDQHPKRNHTYTVIYGKPL